MALNKCIFKHDLRTYLKFYCYYSHCSKKPKVPFQGAPPRLICVMISWTMVMFNNTKEIFLVEGKFDHFFGQK